MEIKQCEFKTKCEINGCKNIATYDLSKQNERKFGIKLCEECAKQMYECLGKIHIPKGIDPPYKNPKKIRSK